MRRAISCLSTASVLVIGAFAAVVAAVVGKLAGLEEEVAIRQV